MDRDRFVALSIVAIGAVILGFVVRGSVRIVLDVGVANLLAAPLILGGFAMVVALTAVAVLAMLGRGPLLRSHDND